MPVLTRHTARQVVACGIAYSSFSLFFGFQNTIIGPTASLLARQAHVTEADLAPVMAMSGIGMVIGGIPSGYLLDNFPGHVVLGACHLVQAAGFLLMPLCRSVLSLAAVFGTISITFIVVNTALNCLSIWVTTPSGDGNDGPVSTAFLLNSISVLFGVGALFAPLAVNWCTQLLGSGTHVFLAAACLSGVSLLALCCALPHSPAAVPEALDDQPALVRGVLVTRPPSSGSLAGMGRPSDVGNDASRRTSLEPLRTHDGCAAAAAAGCTAAAAGGAAATVGSVGPPHALASKHMAWAEPPHHDFGVGDAADLQHAALCDGVSGDSGGGGTGSHVPSPAAARLTAMRSRVGTRAYTVFVTSLMLLMFANIGIELGYGNWCYTYCVRYMGLSERTSQRISSCYWLFFTLARLPAMLLLRWVSVEAILAATMPLAIAGPCAAMLLRAQAGSTGAVALATAVSILVAVGAAAGMPCALSVATEYVHVDGFLSGVIGTIVGLGATTFPYVVPALASAFPWFGFQWLMVATLVMGAVQLLGLLAMLTSAHAMGKLPFADPTSLGGPGDSSKAGASATHSPRAGAAAHGLLEPLLEARGRGLPLHQNIDPQPGVVAGS